jgi:hypothetical protein
MASYSPTIQNNATWEATITITQADGTPFNLLDYTGESQIKTADGATVLATPVITIIDAAAGQLKIFIPLEQTALLKPTSTALPPKPPLPTWDVLIGNSDKSKVYKIIKGDVIVEAGVTHWT